jgi:hypothetical protein
MASLSGIDLGRDGIGHLLADNQLRVPFYQRAYAWKKPHVRGLFDDLRRAIDEGGKDYFLGSIVACGANCADIEIVDGQQRLATATILLAAIRDHLFTFDEDAAKDIEREYLFHRKGLRKRTETNNLTLSEVDADFFRKHVLSPPGSSDRQVKPLRESHRRIMDAARFAKEHVTQIVGNRKPADQLTVLEHWIEFIRDKAKIIFIKVPDPADAFVIFETLNDRGLELSIADLAKNYLFGRSGSRVEEAKHCWATMMGSLSAVSGDTDISKFYIHQLWSSLHGVTRDKELFTKLRDKIHTEHAAIDFLNALVENAHLYAALRNTDHEYWNPYGQNAKQHINILNSSLRVSQIRVLLLAVLRRFGAAEVKKVLPHAVGWSVRFLVAGGSPGNLESYYATRAVKVQKGEITTAAELIRSMAIDVPNDDLFRAAFATETVSSDFIVRYYLNCLERVRNNEANPHLATADETIGTLEHILPRSPDRDVWKVDDDTLDRLCRRIGNLTLLAPKENSNRGNHSFKEAKKHYAKSGFTITRDLTALDDWNEGSIQQRQAALADLAVKAWLI